MEDIMNRVARVVLSMILSSLGCAEGNPEIGQPHEAGYQIDGYSRSQPSHASRNQPRESLPIEVANGMADIPLALDKDDEPTGIFFATCESEPDEVAVPLNAFKDRYCDTVQAVAYRTDDEGAYPVSATYDWSISDPTVAQLLPLPGHEHKGVQRPTSLYDIFWASDQAAEPKTVITVCATPKGGWPLSNHPPLCRSLPLFAVVNLDGAWCFSGATFQTDCDTRLIRQDGRFLEVGGGKGTVDGKEVVFYGSGMEFLYQAVLSTHENMAGTVRDAYTYDELGSWQAWRLPLP